MPLKIKAFAESALVDPITVNVGRAGAANLDVIQVGSPLTCLMWGGGAEEAPVEAGRAEEKRWQGGAEEEAPVKVDERTKSVGRVGRGRRRM